MGARRAEPPGLVVEPTRPSAIGAQAWSSIAGPWEIDYSYASMRAVEAHPFNDSDGPDTFWWLLRLDGRPVGFYTGYVTETYNFATLFAFGVLRATSRAADAVYLWLNRRGLYRRLHRFGLARIARINAGRTRVLFLSTPTADVGGQLIGEAARDLPPETYLPALVRMIEQEAGARGAEQITFREAAEGDGGPFRYPNLWRARDASGRRILEAAGYHRDPGFPPAFVDLRAVQAQRPNDGDAIYAFYRHETAAAFVAYDGARAAWLAEAAATRVTDATAALPMEDVLRHPSLAARSDETRLHRFRAQLFRCGILPDALVELAQLDRAERGLKSAPRTAHRLEGLRAQRDDLRRQAAILEASASGSAHEDPDTVVRARRILSGEGPPASAAGDVRRLAGAHRAERALFAAADQRFATLPSSLRSTYLQLAAGRIRNPEAERRRLLTTLGWTVDAPAETSAALEAELDARIALAASEADRDRELRRRRSEIAELRRTTGVRPEEAGAWLRAMDLLERNGGSLPEGLDAPAAELASLRARLDDAERAIADGEAHLHRVGLEIQGLLLGEAADAVGTELRAAMHAAYRREQDRIAAAKDGAPPRSAAERRSRLVEYLQHRPLDFGRLLVGIDSLRDTDRDRLVREHEAHRAAVRAMSPDQPGPVLPAFDAEGYLAEGLRFIPRDERVWTNLGDQDRITRLYARTMTGSMIRHDVEDWPYRAAYRAAGRESGDQMHVSTLRAGGPEGPIVAAVTLKRSPAGHFRPERIAKPGPDFGAYYTLVIMVMAHELSLAGTFCSLGQTAQGTKLREFGAEFIDVREYTRFHGFVPILFSFDRIRRRAFRKIHVDRILEIAALPPSERAAARRRHGIRWRI